jgi:transposase
VVTTLYHDVRLIPAQYVKPFLKGHKNDYRDAEAIAEAVQRGKNITVISFHRSARCRKRCHRRLSSRSLDSPSIYRSGHLGRRAAWERYAGRMIEMRSRRMQ